MFLSCFELINMLDKNKRQLRSTGHFAILHAIFNLYRPWIHLKICSTRMLILVPRVLVCFGQ